MSAYILYRPSKCIGPDFNEAAQIVKKHDDVVIKETIQSPGPSAFLVDASEQTVEALRGELKGWIISKDNPVYHI